MNARFTRNAYLIYSPFFLINVYYVIKHKWPVLYGDEPRYVSFATNLLHGFYSTPAPHINLWSGPGYPIVLIPFIALHLPIICMPLMNAVFHYLSVVFFYKAASNFATHKIALFFGLLWAVFPNMYPFLPAILTEVFTGFLVSAFIYSLSLFYSGNKTRHLVLSGFLLGYLALTKIIFGYMLLIVLLVCLLLWLIRKSKPYYLKSVYILLIAFAVTFPYLCYTYQLTGKVFYWGNSGGMSLYWMSTPSNLEYGDWKQPDLTNNQFPVPYRSAEGDSILKLTHGKEVSAIMRHNEMEQDALFKKAAISNIKSHPPKFIRNYFYNVSRMLFDFPYSYSYQNEKIISDIISGSFLLWASLIAAIVSLRNWRGMIYPVKFSMLLIIIYLLLTGMLSAYARQLDVVVPVLLFWIAVTLSRMPRINLKFSDQDIPV